MNLDSAARGEPPGPDLLTRIRAIHVSTSPYRGLLPFREILLQQRNKRSPDEGLPSRG
jgi:hypothetical protein